MFDPFGWLFRVAEIRKIEATILFPIEGRIAVRFRWHLGSVEERRTVSYLVCDHHNRRERTRRTTSRMPVILQIELYEDWLRSSTDLAALKKLLSPFPASKMKSHPVSSAVNYPENDNGELIMRMDAEVGTTPSLF